VSFFLDVGRERMPADCVVRVDDVEIVELYPFLTSVEVAASRADAARATLVFESARGTDGTWQVQDSGLLAPWKRVRIDAAFGGRTVEIMRGYIRDIDAAYPEEPGPATFTVTCQDDSLRLDRSHVRRVWGADSPTSDRAIVSEIAGAAGLTVAGDSGDGQSGLTLNQDGTDIQFLRDRAEANGYELSFADGAIYFGPSRLDAQPQPTLLVYAGPDTNCLRFSVRADGHQPDAVTFDAAPGDGSEPVQRTMRPNLRLLGRRAADSAAAGLPDFTWRMTRQGAADEDALAARAQRLANELALRVRAEGELDGSLYGGVLRVGLPVGVDGIGDTLGGLYYVDGATHRFDHDGYRVSFALLRNAFGDDLGWGSARDPLAGLF
jgi:phage protein D